MEGKIKKDFDNVSFWIIGVITFFMPLFFLPVSIIGLSQAKISFFAIGTILALIFFVIERIRRGSVVISLNYIYLSIFLLLSSILTSSILSINPYKSFIGSLIEIDTFHTLLTGFVFLFLVSTVVTSYKKVMFLIGAFVSGVVLSVLFKLILLTNVLNTFLLPTESLSGNWSDLTLLSLLVLGVLIVVLETVKMKYVYFYSLCFLILVPFFFVSVSGISFDLYFTSISLQTLIAFVSVILFAYVFSIKRMKEKKGAEIDTSNRLSVRLIPSIIIVSLSIIFVVFAAPLNGFLSRISNVSYVEGRPNWQATYLVAEKVLKERPVFGSGPNTFSTEWNLNKTSDSNNFLFWNTDFNFGVGIVPTSLITSGILGFVLWLLFYTVIIFIAFKSLFRTEKSEEIKIVKIIVSFVVIGTSFLALFYTGGIVIFFAHMLFIGLLLSFKPIKTKTILLSFNKSQWQNFVSTLFFITLIIAIVYSAYLVILKGVASYNYRKVQSASDLNNALSYIQKSIMFDKQNALYYVMSSQIYAAKVSEMASLPQSDLENRKEELNVNISNALSFAVAAERIDPNDYKIRVATGKTLEFLSGIGLKDANEAALERYLLASELSPSNPLPPLYVSSLFLRLDNKEKAREFLSKAISLKSDYSDVPELGKEIQLMIDEVESRGVIKAPVATSSATSTKEQTEE